jgi:mono/diheme cytochrome c family protein
MTMHEPRMTTTHVPTTRRFGAIALFGGAALAMALSVTSTPAAQAADPPAKPAAAGAVDAKAVYEAKCQVCHMADGNSQLMPNMSFADGIWKHGSTLKAVETSITDGVPGTAMVAFKEQLTPAEITALAKFVRKFDKKLK